MAVPAIPAVGDNITASWGAIVAGWGQAWSTTTSLTLTASTTSPTMGTGGGVNCHYARNGNEFCADIQVSFGTSGSAAGSGTYAVTGLPISLAFGASGVVGVGHIKCNGLYTPVQLIWASATSFNLYYISAVVNGSLTAVTNAAPGVWTNNDLMRLLVRGIIA